MQGKKIGQLKRFHYRRVKIFERPKRVLNTTNFIIAAVRGKAHFPFFHANKAQIAGLQVCGSY